MSGNSKFIIIASLLLLLFSCKKIRQLPPEPVIDFRSFIMFDSTDILGNIHRAGVLEFHFEDGDGDIGITQPIPGLDDQDTTNLIFYLYKKLDGQFLEPDDTLNYRVPYIDRIGQNKVIQGTIEITFLYIGFSDSDTIKYDFFLEDRAGNISNTSSSCEIVFSGDGGCLSK